MLAKGCCENAMAFLHIVGKYATLYLKTKEALASGAVQIL